MLSTGDELCEPSTSQLGPGQIRDANRAMLLAAASEAGADVTDFGVARDREEDVKAAFQRVVDSDVDILLTSGELLHRDGLHGSLGKSWASCTQQAVAGIQHKH